MQSRTYIHYALHSEYHEAKAYRLRTYVPRRIIAISHLLNCFMQPNWFFLEDLKFCMRVKLFFCEILISAFTLIIRHVLTGVSQPFTQPHSVFVVKFSTKPERNQIMFWRQFMGCIWHTQTFRVYFFVKWTAQTHEDIGQEQVICLHVAVRRNWPFCSLCLTESRTMSVRKTTYYTPLTKISIPSRIETNAYARDTRVRSGNRWRKTSAQRISILRIIGLSFKRF